MSECPPLPAAQAPPFPGPAERPVRYYRWLSHWRDLLAATRALRDLVEAHLPLPQGLAQLSRDAPRHALRRSFYWLYRELSGGLTLYEAMENQPDFFPPFYVDLIRTGENGGQLAEVLADLERELQEQLEFRRRVASTNAYLAATLSIQFLVIAFFMTFAAPQILAIAPQLGGYPSRFLELASTIHRAGFTFAILVAAIMLPIFWVALEYSHLRSGELSQLWGRVIRWIPLIGPAQRRGQLACAAAILGRLLRAGVPLPDALRRTAKAAIPPSCRTPFLKVAAEIEAGESLGDALNRDASIFPVTFRTMVALGESSGQLPEALRQISVLYRTQSVHRLRMVLELGSPLLVVLNGLLVFFIYVGFFVTLSTFPLMIR